jgi:glycosidase
MPLLRLLVTLLIVLTLALQGVASTPKLSDVPAWAKEAVWYQIFPERFRNGDPANDPTVKDILGSWPHDEPSEWGVSRWTADWYKLQPWEEKNGKGFYYNVQQRRYGGDLQGVLDKLDYLQQLGITAIYFNPLFESPSLHKYDATMYHHIDNNFGPDPEGDRALWAKEDPGDPATWQWTAADRLFLKLIQEAHRRGIRIVIDGVFNHVGMTFWAFVDVRKNQEKSKYKDWFIISQFDDPATPENEFRYAGWFGVRELPELREDENGLVPPVRQHIHAIVKRWMDPNGDGDPSDGIDGWRLDVADMVALPFWREFRTWVRAINPNAYLTGEVWWEDYAKEKMYNASRWLEGDAFDAVMNYRLARECGYFFKAKERKISASEFAHRLDSLRREYRNDVNYVLMNLLDSHDTDRLASQIVNPDTRYDGMETSVMNWREYQIRKPNAEELKTQKLMVMFQMTYVGAPMVYYGDEAGMWGGDDPDDRKPMLWADMTYDNESHHPFGEQRPDDVNRFDENLFAHYATCIRIRRNSNALKLGGFESILADDENDVLAFHRWYGNEHVVVVLNNSPSTQRVEVPLSTELQGLTWKNLFDRSSFTVTRSTLRTTLKGKSGIILQAMKER